ncbi:MAG: hypothetical protein R3B06_04270 [Kofleriaceae bacterium]
MDPPARFSPEELDAALRALASTLAKCTKVLPKLTVGSSQHTLLTRRIRALEIAVALIERERGA